MVKHDRDGALGIIINRPASNGRCPTFWKRSASPILASPARWRIHAGGPVEPSIGFVLHSAEYKLDATLEIDGRVAMSANRKAMRDIAYGRGPKKFLIAFGYAGWAPGQLEGEIANGGWYTHASDVHLVFDSPRDTLWRDTMATRTRDL